jgi:hypothetical protein
MIGRADIEGSKSNVAMNAWLPQASGILCKGGRESEREKSARARWHENGDSDEI